MDKMLPRLCKEAGVKPFTFHCIRHHVAAILATRLSLPEIQKILRHKRATTTDIYLRSLVKVSTKGIKVLDDIAKGPPDNLNNIISFERAVNMSRHRS
jgi:integrase